MYDNARKAKPSIRPTQEHRKVLGGWRTGAAVDATGAPALGTVALDLSKFPLWDPRTGLPSPEDVKQGGVGDCWVLATLASLAATAPEHLKGLIKLKSDRRFQVRLDTELDVGPLIHCSHQGHGSKAHPLYSGFTKAAWVAVMVKAILRGS